MENTYSHPDSIKMGSGTGSGPDHEIENITGPRYAKTMAMREMGRGVQRASIVLFSPFGK